MPEVALGYLFFGIVCVAYSFLPGANDPVEVDEADSSRVTEAAARSCRPRRLRRLAAAAGTSPSQMGNVSSLRTLTA